MAGKRRVYDGHYAMIDVGEEHRGEQRVPRLRFLNTWLNNTVKFREQDTPEEELTVDQQIDLVMERNLKKYRCEQ